MMAGQGRPTQRTPRRKVLIRAQMRCGGPKTDVCIRDVSPRGMLLQSSAPPPCGTYVEIVQGGSPVVGQVIWMKDRKFGISTRDVIDIRALEDDTRPGARSVAVGRKVESFRPAAHAIYDHENSRHLANTMQFATIVAVIVCAAAGLAFVLHEGLSGTVGNIANNL